MHGASTSGGGNAAATWAVSAPDRRCPLATMLLFSYSLQIPETPGQRGHAASPCMPDHTAIASRRASASPASRACADDRRRPSTAAAWQVRAARWQDATVPVRCRRRRRTTRCLTSVSRHSDAQICGQEQEGRGGGRAVRRDAPQLAARTAACLLHSMRLCHPPPPCTYQHTFHLPPTTAQHPPVGTRRGCSAQRTGRTPGCSI